MAKKDFWAKELRLSSKVEYGMKEFLQGALVGFIIGFLIATQLV